MPTASQIGLVKLGINVVASASVWKIVNDVIKHNVAIETGADVVKVWTGSLIIGSMVADQASKHVNEKFDSALAWMEARANENKGSNVPPVNPEDS
jgi:hypothetical protein